MRTNAPGLSLMGVFFALFSILVAVAWSQDAALDWPLPSPTSEHICDRLNHELAQQVGAQMISRKHRHELLTRCWSVFK